MVPMTTTIACAITLFVSLLLPLLLALGFAAKNKKQGILSAWLLGAAGFLVTQIAIRLPILTVLSKQAWFLRFYQEHMFLYSLALAFTAGLFELVGRFLVAKVLQKKMTARRALAAGLGHGGIEAMVIIGLAYINNLVYIFMINAGSFDAMLSQLPADQAAAMETVRVALLTTSAPTFLLAGFERILTMVAHAALSMLVCWGVYSGKAVKCLLICLGIHTLIDLTAGISLLAGTALSQTAVYCIIYTILTAVALLSIFMIKDICRRFQEVEYA